MKNIFDKKWFKEIVFFIVFLFIVNFLFYTINKVAPYPIDKETAYVSPDESAAIYFLENIKNNKTLFLNSEIKEEIRHFFKPRQAVVVENNVVPRKFPGFYLVFFPIYLFFYDNLNLISNFIGSFFLVSSYLFFRRAFGKKIAIFSTIFLSLNYAFLFYNQIKLFSEILSSLFLILGFFFFIGSLYRQKFYLNLFLSSLFISLSLLLRLDYIVFVILGFFTFVLMEKKQFNFKFISKNVLISFFVVIVSLIPSLIINKIYYGNHFTVGYVLADTDTFTKKEEENSKKSNFEILNKTYKRVEENIKRLNLVPNNFYDIFSNSMGPLFLFFILSLIYCLFFEKNLKIKKYSIFISLLLIYFILFFLTYDSIYGSVKRSENRYFMPFYVFLVPIISIFIFSFRKKYLIFIFLIFNLFLSINKNIISCNYCLISENSYRERESETKKKIKETIPVNSIVITNYYDKIIIPYYKIVHVDSELSSQELVNMIGSILDSELSGELYVYKLDKVVNLDINYVLKTLSENSLETFSLKNDVFLIKSRNEK